MPLNFKHINGNEQILDGSIGTDLIADGAITAPKLAIGAITSSSLTIDSNLDFNNFQALQFRVENLDYFPPTGNPGRLIWRTDLRDLYVDTDYALNIISARYVPFQVHEVTSLTDMSVSSTVGMLPGDALLQGGVPFGDIEIVEIVDLSNLVVDSTVGVNVGDVIGQDNASTTVVSITDTTHLVVASTVGFVPDIAILSTPYVIATITSITDGTNLVVSDTTGFAGRATANVNFGIVTVIDPTNLEVDNSTAISVGDVIQQGFTTTTVTAVIDLTHIAVVDTTGFAVGICDVLVLIDISAIPNSSTLIVSKTTGFGPGNPITQGAASTTIISVIDGTTLTVGSTSGFVVNSAVDSTVEVDDTALVNAGMLLTQGVNNSLIVSVVDATHLAVANASPFVAGPASTGNWVAINDGGSVNSIRSDANPQLQGNITLASGTNVDLAQVSQTITVNVPAAGTTGQLQFNDNVANEFGADSNLFWDNVTKRLGIGNAAPTTTLDVTGDGHFTNDVTVDTAIHTPLVTGTSPLMIRPGTDSVDGIQVQNAAGSSTILDVDTTNNRVGVNTSLPDADLHVSGTTHITSDTTIDTQVNVNLVKGRTGTLTLEDLSGNAWTFDAAAVLTNPGEVRLSDDNQVTFNAALDSFIKYSTNHGGMVLSAGPGGNFNTEGQFALWTNTLADGSGTYSPAFVLNSADGINLSTATGGVLIDDDLTGSGPVASAKLEVKSTTRGLLTPRMTTVQRDAIASPATGLLIYNTTTSQEEYYNGTIWAPIGNTAVAGNNTEIQYNDNGVFGADPMLVWRAVDNTLRVGTDGEGAAISITGTSGGYLYWADENVTASTQRIVGGAASDFLIKNQVAGKDIQLESENLISLQANGYKADISGSGTDWTLNTGANNLVLIGDSSILQSTSGSLFLRTPGNGTVIIPGRGDGYNEVQLHGSSGAYIDFFDTTGSAISSRIVNNVGTNFRVGTKEATPLELYTNEDGTIRTWTFDTAGDLTTPGDVIINGQDLFVDNIHSNGSSTLDFYTGGLDQFVFHGTGSDQLRFDSGVTDQVYFGWENGLGLSRWMSRAGARIQTDFAGSPQIWDFDTAGDLTNPGNVSIPVDKKLFFDTNNVYLKKDSTFGDILVGNTGPGDSGLEIATASASSALTLYSNAGGTFGGNWAQIDLMPGVNPNVRLAPGGTGFVDVTTHLISNVVDPVSAQDAATKNYVDGPAHTVAGNDTEIQYNNAGVFGADPKFRWDATNNTILVGTAPVLANYYGLSIDDGSISLKDGTDTAGGIGLDMFNSSNTYLGGLYYYSSNGSAELLTQTGGILLNAQMANIDITTAAAGSNINITTSDTVTITAPGGGLLVEELNIYDDGSSNMVVETVNGSSLVVHSDNDIEISNVNGDVDISASAGVITIENPSQGSSITIPNDGTINILATGGNVNINANSEIHFSSNDRMTWFDNEGRLYIEAPSTNALDLYQPNASSFLKIRMQNVDTDEFDVAVNGNNNTLFLQDNSVGTNQPAIAVTNTNTVGFATSVPHASALVEMNSTAQGFLPPRMTTAQKNAIGAPATGLTVYDTTLNLLQTFNGTTWVTVGQATFEQEVFNITGPGNVFNLAFTPIVNSQIVYYNGLALAPGGTEDYTVSGNVVTLDAGIVLANGDKILIVYSHY